MKIPIITLKKQFLGNLILHATVVECFRSQYLAPPFLIKCIKRWCDQFYWGLLSFGPGWGAKFWVFFFIGTFTTLSDSCHFDDDTVWGTFALLSSLTDWTRKYVNFCRLVVQIFAAAKFCEYFRACFVGENNEEFQEFCTNWTFPLRRVSRSARMVQCIGSKVGIWKGVLFLRSTVSYQRNIMSVPEKPPDWGLYCCSSNYLSIVKVTRKQIWLSWSPHHTYLKTNKLVTWLDLAVVL